MFQTGEWYMTVKPEKMELLLSTLRESPKPIGGWKLFQKAGYGSFSVLRALTLYSPDVYEEDDGKIGLLGVHIDPDDYNFQGVIDEGSKMTRGEKRALQIEFLRRTRAWRRDL